MDVGNGKKMTFIAYNNGVDDEDQNKKYYKIPRITKKKQKQKIKQITGHLSLLGVGKLVIRIEYDYYLPWPESCEEL